MWVKICGITTMKAALAADEAGADAVGFVFAPSRRQITPDRAQALIAGLPDDLHRVGVFVDETPERINEIARYVGLTLVQLHGSEGPEVLEKIDVPVIKAFRIKDAADLAQLPEWRKAPGLLLDTHVAGQQGGTGETFDWGLVRQATALLQKAGVELAGADEGLTAGKCKLILAGGLTPENLWDAIGQAQPGGVDVSSGVETNGEKDIDLIYKFVKMARGASR